MKIAVLSDTRLPTEPDGTHGLGRSAHDIAAGLAKTNNVTLFGGNGSVFQDGDIICHVDERKRATELLSTLKKDNFDVVLDTSHYHTYSLNSQALPTLNRICDTECDYKPINSVVNSVFMQEKYSTAKLVLTGINVKNIPLLRKKEPGDLDFYVFMGSTVHHKRKFYVVELGKRLDIDIRYAYDLRGKEKWDFLKEARALLCPSTKIDAAPRFPLEVAACGIPIICVREGGTPHHVYEGITGHICEDLEDFENFLKENKERNTLNIDPQKARDCIEKYHNYDEMVLQYTLLLERIMNGETW